MAPSSVGREACEVAVRASVLTLQEYLSECDAELKALLLLQGKLEAGVARCERQERQQAFRYVKTHRRRSMVKVAVLVRPYLATVST